MRFGFFTILAITLFFPGIIFAEGLGEVGSSDPFSISVAPQYPAPGSSATISFLSYLLDLNNATVTVSVGNKQIYKGTSQPISIPLGKAGSVTSVTVVISSGTTSYTKSLVLQPQDVSIIVEPISSSPVLYPGKPSVPLEGDSRIVAVANISDAGGKAIDPSTLSYSWTVDGAQIANSSGIGKSAIIVASPLQYRERPVSVVVQSQMGNLVGGASLSLAPKEPTVRLYENDPLLGIRFDHALPSTYSIRGAELSVYAAPFSMPLIHGTPFVQWFLNGSPVQTGSLVTLRPSGKGEGDATLSLTASTGTSLNATSLISLSFGAKRSTNFFGL